jgi:hypothetical protein
MSSNRALAELEGKLAAISAGGKTADIDHHGGAARADRLQP